MRTFYLQRDHDVSGISGTGVVAEGIEFDDGSVALRWCVGDHRSTNIWSSIEDVKEIHGHTGLTQVIYVETNEELRERLAAKIERFAVTDSYNLSPVHGPGFMKGYDAALERAVELVRGNINSWSDRRPPSKNQ